MAHGGPPRCDVCGWLLAGYCGTHRVLGLWKVEKHGLHFQFFSEWFYSWIGLMNTELCIVSPALLALPALNPPEPAAVL